MCSDPWIYRCIKLEALENFHNRHKSTSNSAQTQNFRSFPVILSCSYCAKLFPLPETPFHVFIKKTFTKHLLYHKFWAAARNTTGMRTLLTALNPGSIARFLSIIWLIWLKSFDNKVKCEQKNLLNLLAVWEATWFDASGLLHVLSLFPKVRFTQNYPPSLVFHCDPLPIYLVDSYREEKSQAMGGSHCTSWHLLSTYYPSGPVLNVLKALSPWSLPTILSGSFHCILVLQMRKLRLREVKWLSRQFNPNTGT